MSSVLSLLTIQLHPVAYVTGFSSSFISSSTYGDIMILTRFSKKYNERQIRLIEYLKTQVKPGANFFKAKYIAMDTGLSSREVGTNMAILSEICPEFRIKPYSYSSSTTWLVTTPQG